jgi:hypothetical protein
MCGEECVYCATGLKALRMSIRSNWSSVLLLIVSLTNQTIIYKWDTEISVIVMLVSIFHFSPINVCLIHVGALLLSACVFVTVLSR